MIHCPLCDFSNIEGEDFCQECEQPLNDLHSTPPLTLIEKALVRDRLRVLEPATPITVASDTSVSDVITLMDQRSIGCVLVVDNDELVGVFTERDVIQRVAEQLESLADCPVSQFMTSSPQTLDPRAKVVFAVRQMDLGGFRHIPIVDDKGTAHGVISVRDILRYFTKVIRQES